MEKNQKTEAIDTILTNGFLCESLINNKEILNTVSNHLDSIHTTTFLYNILKLYVVNRICFYDVKITLIFYTVSKLSS